MTTIAYDGKYLCADTRHNSGHFLWKYAPKIRAIKHGKHVVLIGSTGSTGDCLIVENAFIEKLKKQSTRNLNIFSVDVDNKHFDNATLIVVMNKIAYEYSCIHPEEIQSFMAWGSGRAYAQTAMHLGRSAIEAVRIAGEFDANTGGIMTVITIDDGKVTECP